MPLPPRNMKIRNGNVIYEESVDRANYLITELTRAAMKDVAKFILKIVKANVRAIPDIKTSKMKKYAAMRYQYWVRKKEGDLLLGIENTSKGAKTAWFADQAELGTANQPKRGFLRSAVYENIDKIREIEAHYLSAIEDELAAAAMCDESENDPEEDV